MSKGSSFLSIALLCLGVGASCAGDTSKPVDALRLNSFLSAYFSESRAFDQGTSARIKYLRADADLNDDDDDEVLVYR